MSRRELLMNICPTDYVNTNCQRGCDNCFENMNKILDEYDKQIRADAIDETKQCIIPTLYEFDVMQDAIDCCVNILEQLKE